MSWAARVLGQNSRSKNGFSFHLALVSCAGYRCSDFGTSKLKNMGKDLGGAVKGFKEGMKEAQDEPAKPAQVADQKPAEAPVAKEEAKPEEKKQA